MCKAIINHEGHEDSLLLMVINPKTKRCVLRELRGGHAGRD